MRAVSRTFLVFLALIAVRFASAQPVVANGNGDFEQVDISVPGNCSDCPTYFSFDGNSIPGWTRSGDTNGAAGDGLVAHIGFSDSTGSNTRAGHGSQFAILGGGQAGPGTAYLTTSVTGLTAGTKYTLSFMIAFEGENPPNTQSITASLSGASFYPSGSAAQTFTTSPLGPFYWQNWENA